MDARGDGGPGPGAARGGDTMRVGWGATATMRPKRSSLAVVLLVLLSIVGMTTAASGAPAEADRLEMYRATVNAATLQTLQQGGYDVASVQETPQGTEVALVLTGAERERLRGQGVRLEVWRDKQGRTQRRATPGREHRHADLLRTREWRHNKWLGTIDVAVTGHTLRSL